MDPKAMFQLTYGLFVLTAQEKRQGQRLHHQYGSAGDICAQPHHDRRQQAELYARHDPAHRHFCGVNSRSDNAVCCFSAFRLPTDAPPTNSQAWPCSAHPKACLSYRACSAWISARVVAYDGSGHAHALSRRCNGCRRAFSGLAPVTYTYYQSEIKPKPETPKKKGWRCRICGYLYEGDPLPADFVCPICKHGAADFEPVG